MGEATKRQATIRQTLVRMKSILQKRGWVKGYYAKTKTGRMVEHHSNAAVVGYCLTGARFVALDELDCENPLKVKRLIEDCVPGGLSPEAYNDARATKKSDVIAVINCAIQKAATLN